MKIVRNRHTRRLPVRLAGTLTRERYTICWLLNLTLHKENIFLFVFGQKEEENREKEREQWRIFRGIFREEILRIWPNTVTLPVPSSTRPSSSTSPTSSDAWIKETLLGLFVCLFVSSREFFSFFCILLINQNSFDFKLLSLFVSDSTHAKIGLERKSSCIPQWKPDLIISQIEFVGIFFQWSFFLSFNYFTGNWVKEFWFIS